MFLVFEDLPTVNSYTDLQTFLDNKKQLVVDFSSSKDAIEVFNTSTFDVSDWTQEKIESVPIPYLTKKLRYTISDKPGDPSDPTVSPGNVYILKKANIDNHSIVKLNFRSEESNCIVKTFCFPLSLLSKEDCKFLIAGKKFYINERSFEC